MDVNYLCHEKECENICLLYLKKITRQSNRGRSHALACVSGAKHGKGGGDEKRAVVPKFLC
jgi:hypothetical protein